jgi:hypothetical protein
MRRFLRRLLREPKRSDRAWREWGEMKRALADVEIRAERRAKERDRSR